MHVLNVERHLNKATVSRNMKVLTLGRSPLHTSHVRIHLKTVDLRSRMKVKSGSKTILSILIYQWQFQCQFSIHQLTMAISIPIVFLVQCQWQYQYQLFQNAKSMAMSIPIVIEVQCQYQLFVNQYQL